MSSVVTRCVRIKTTDDSVVDHCVLIFLVLWSSWLISDQECCYLVINQDETKNDEEKKNMILR